MSEKLGRTLAELLYGSEGEGGFRPITTDEMELRKALESVRNDEERERQRRAKMNR